MSLVMAVGFGVLAGAIVTAVAVMVTMRQRMVVPQRSERSFDETCAAVESTVPGDGWGFPMESLDMTGQLREKGAVPDGVRRIRLYFVCNPKIAARVLSHTPAMAGIMPCSWAIIEKDDGSIWLSKMNVGLMGKMFPAPIRRAMGEVAAADTRFMDRVLRSRRQADRQVGLQPQPSTES